MSRRNARILLVDDDPSFLEVLKFNVIEDGHDAETAAGGEEALVRLAEQPFDLLITDLRMPGMSGEELVAAAAQRYPNLPILVVTAYADVESAVMVMRQGASDLVTKPLQRDLFRHSVRQVLDARRLQNENAELRRELDTRGGLDRIVATSTAMMAVLEMIKRIAPSDATLLLEGESGTGKEVLARALHQLSPRSQGRFVAVNCAAIPGELLESDLFGHTKGAFTGATRSHQGRFLQANGGTLFLDEVGALPEPLQAKLLRVLQEREVDLVGGSAPVPVDARVVAATNTDLEAAVAAGTFRDDLYYRLNVIGIRVPPLRHREDDILPLFHHFLAEQGLDTVQLDAAVRNALAQYKWPGNVRELQNLCQRLALLRAAPDRISWEDLPPNVQMNRGTVPRDDLRIEVGPEGLSFPDAERQILIYGLERTNWNQTHAAKFLGISRQTLIYRMAKFNLTAPGATSPNEQNVTRSEAAS